MNRLLEGFWGVIAGIFMALLSAAIILGAFSLALTEGGRQVALLASPTPAAVETGTAIPQVIVFTSPPGEPAFTPSALPTASPTASVPPPPTSCVPPPGWIPVTVSSGDTIESLAQLYGVTAGQLAGANCLLTTSLIAGTILYAPEPPPNATGTEPAPPPPPTNTPIPCGPPRGWTSYVVRSGDTLFSIGRAYGVSVSQLQFANCLGSSTRILAGQRLAVPNVPTRTSIPSLTPVPTETALPTPLPTTEIPPTDPPPPTFTPTPLPTPTLAPTETPNSTPTEAPPPDDPGNAEPALEPGAEQPVWP